MAIVEKFKKYYKLLPVQLTIVNERAAQIAGEIYKAAIENNSFADNEAFRADYEHRLEKYIVYYDIGKSILDCSDIKINRTTTEHEMQANRRYMTILEEAFQDAKLSAEDEICKEILYAAVEKNEQYDGMGFPQCLKGQNISPLGRILAVSDYIARKFIDGEAEQNLVAKLKMKLGKKYDPDVVELAIGVIGNLYQREKAAIPAESEEFRSIQMLYQPVCDATGGVAKEYAGFICLNDEVKGTVMPSFYMPVAERNARIMDITKYGLEFFFQDVANNKFADPTAPRTFSVNISMDCLLKPTFLGFIKKMIRDFAVNPQRVIFEVDAASVDANDPKVIECLRGYKELGFRLSIDRYGVDNASLLKLQDLEVDQIKIDRSFIDKICDNKKSYEIVKNTIKLAKDLEIGVVAQGVDTEQQKALLLEMKCFYMQGRLFGEPDYLSI